MPIRGLLNIDSRSVNVWVGKGNLHCYQDEYSEGV